MLRANNVGLVSYERVHESYLRQRKLKGNANGWLLWSLGVGAVIGGEFSGWNFGLDKGGFVGLALALVAFLACFSDPSYRPSLIGIAVVMGLSLFYFMVFSRHKIVAKAPEEKAALLASTISQTN